MYDYSDYVSKKESFWDMLMSNSIYQVIWQWAVIVLLVVILFFVILTFVTVKRRTTNVVKNYVANGKSESGVVFCKKCATQFEASEKYCPKCGTAR